MLLFVPPGLFMERVFTVGLPPAWSLLIWDKEDGISRIVRIIFRFVCFAGTSAPSVMLGLVMRETDN